jgi:cation transport protein ChaC
MVFLLPTSVSIGRARGGEAGEEAMGGQGTWVFAYGSLLWEPGFEPAEAVPARVHGFRRSFCLWSIRWRGTEEAPGLVLALDEDEGASCEGLALRLPDAEAPDVLRAIRARELVSDAYEERRLPMALGDGREVEALAYVIRAGHAQHACLPREEQARTIARARGARGPNRDYLIRTAERLRELGIRDPEIEALLARVEAIPAP